MTTGTTTTDPRLTVFDPPDRIQAAPQPVQPSVRNPMRDPVPGKAELERLPLRDHGMLPPHERQEGTPPIPEIAPR